MSLWKHGGRRDGSGGASISYVTIPTIPSEMLRRNATQERHLRVAARLSPPETVGELNMGSHSRQRAANRFQTALQQRLDATSDPNEAQQAYDDALEGLIKIAIDEIELDRVAWELATNPDAIDFPE